MIELHGLTKRFGDHVAVDDVTLAVRPGRVTGFLGPNGAGKSTTMRMVVGLDRPTAGTALVDGRPYVRIAEPLREVGALLDADAVHPGRSARAHLRAMARANGIPVARVSAVLDVVGLTDVAGKRVKGFSLGMRQRLGIAGALLGDPGVLLFDEPVNGLDLDGVRWVRALLRGLADEGRTVLVSSHLMSEMQLVADHLVVIGRGRIIADAPATEVLDGAVGHAVGVTTPDPDVLGAVLRARGATVEDRPPDQLVVRGLDAAAVGELAHAAGVVLHALAPLDRSLEQAYLDLTADSVQYAVGPTPLGVHR